MKREAERQVMRHWRDIPIPELLRSMAHGRKGHHAWLYSLARLIERGYLPRVEQEIEKLKQELNP